ncbi:MULTISPECIES: hypothetical protein [Bacillaceae]|uniref:Uncharacterized protein n=2 Tax=Mesobacillus TaxID=2675231 RepID=A0A0D6Z9S3_9BACI|nr:MULTISPECIES: hypothetical protein [Bacillaceae]KIY22554.1 hypothetical protein UB32_07740 [Mesobacillus subterraneus]MDQ0414999.1 hypothetical protein [Mesobacillus stamsii]
MSKELVQEKEFDITELVEVLSLEDELEMDNDIREWLHTPIVQLKEYGFSEPDSQEEYIAMLQDLSSYLMER